MDFLSPWGWPPSQLGISRSRAISVPTIPFNFLHPDSSSSLERPRSTSSQGTVYQQKKQSKALEATFLALSEGLGGDSNPPVTTVDLVSSSGRNRPARPSRSYSSQAIWCSQDLQGSLDVPISNLIPTLDMPRGEQEAGGEANPVPPVGERRMRLVVLHLLSTASSSCSSAI